MRRIYIVVSILLLLSLVHKHTIVSAACTAILVTGFDTFTSHAFGAGGGGGGGGNVIFTRKDGSIERAINNSTCS